ncbi:MAG: N-acetylneuraminate synthase family protein, partial [Pseudomonadota bacterium]
EFSGQIHISLGMTTRKEEERIVYLAEKAGRLKDVVLYHCISGYPVENSKMYLNEITRLKNLYEDQVYAIGFSGHHMGIAIDIAALTLGATWFERHFTLDRTWKGTDHSASLEPDGLRKVKRDLISAKSALQNKPTEILPIEQIQRTKLKKCHK